MNSWNYRQFKNGYGGSVSVSSNISDGIVTFFGSAGTIFNILIVIAIILAISLVIWAINKFNGKTNGGNDL